MIMNRENTEQRDSIRIKDRVLLSYHPVTPEEFKSRVREYMEGVEDPWVDSCHPTFQKDIKKHLKNIKDRDKDLAAVLEIVDQKLNMILGLIGTEEMCDRGSVPNKLYKVDLSAKGLGFLAKEELSKGTILSLSIGLLPEHYFFTCFGQVVRTEKKSDGWFAGLKFIWITEDDKEKLIEHIFSRQVLHLRMRRLQKEKREKKQD